MEGATVTTESLRLLGHDEASHGALSNGGAGFADTLVELGRLSRQQRPYRVVIPVRQRNLGFVHRVFNLAMRLAGHSRAPMLEAFDPKPMTRLAENLEGYLTRMRSLAQGSPVEPVLDDEELPELARHLQSAAHEANEPELLRLLGILTEGVYIGPRTFHMDLANSCNENCAYCWFHSPASANRNDASELGAAWKRTHIDFHVACRLIDDLAKMGSFEDVLLTGKGEPLTHPRCMDIVEYVKSKGLHTTLFSNGMLLTPENLGRMHRAGLDLVYVSLSSASHGVYEALHPGHEGAELETVRENLHHLRELKEREGAERKPKVVMVDVVCHDNAREVADFARWSRGVGAEFIRYQLIHVQYYNQHLKLTPGDVAAVQEGLDEAKAIASEAGMHVMENIDFQLSTLQEETGAWGRNELPAEGCLVGWYFSRSWADGTVSFCCSPKPIADIKKSSFERIWTGAAYEGYRNAGKRLDQNRHVRFIDGTPLVNSHCFSCPNYEGLGDARRGLRQYGLERWLQR